MLTYLLTLLGLHTPAPTSTPARRLHLATLRGSDRRAYYWCNGR
jgi:hypothetical protein